jgi:hypothetical protein
MLSGTRANRYSFAMHYYMPTRDSVILHTCDNPECCNPEHLVTGSQGENTRDTEIKGRRRHGSAHRIGAKTVENDLKILELHKAGKQPWEISLALGIVPALVRKALLYYAPNPDQSPCWMNDRHHR